MPLIDRNSPLPFYQQVYEQIAHGIESGIYPAGKKLPSIRECARELDVSNTTIELAYQKLTEEGYVTARRGSGYTICQVGLSPMDQQDRYDADYQRALEQLKAQEAERIADESGRQRPLSPKGKQSVYDFAYDSVDPDLFPFTTWARISREVFFDNGAEHACLYNDRQGLRELREQIVRYVGGEYGLVCSAEQILVMPTTRDLISSITGLFEPSKTLFAMENPGYDEVRSKLQEHGFSVTPIPACPYPAWNKMRQCIEGANIVFTTPACQFPSNHAMPIDLRKRLVEWANENNVYLIDDEYGWEFQSSITRTPSLAALDTSGRVITIGTFSNSFTPAVCLSYAVLPPQLMLKWREQQGGAHPQVPWQTQAAMATFMRDDYWRAHIRKMRTAMQRKRALLLEALDKHMGDAVEVLAGPSSLFVLVSLKDGRSEDELVESARESGAIVYPTTRYWQGEPPQDWNYVLIGYAGIAEAAIEPGIKTLASAWGFSD